MDIQIRMPARWTTAEPLEVAPEPGWQPSPYAMLRFAGKPYQELHRLKFTYTIAIIEQIVALQTWLVEHKMAICDDLYAAIAEQGGEARGRLVALKRCVFNERMPAPADLHYLRRGGDPALRRQVIQFAWNLRRCNRLRPCARALFEEELVAKRHLLQQSFADSEFQKAVQLASPSLSQSLRRYIQADPAAMRMRDRKTEAGAFHYLMRMTAKTSPFGRFGPVGRGTVDSWSDRAITVQSAGMQVRSVASFNLSIAGALTASLSRAPDLQRHLPLRVNDSYYIEGDTIAFMRSKMVADLEVYSQLNTLSQGPYSPAMRAIVEFLEARRASPPLAGEVLDHVCSLAGGGADARRKVESLLRKLIDSGLISYDLGLPSNTLDRLAGLHAVIGAINTPDMVQAAAGLEVVDTCVKQFAAASFSEREQLLETLRRHINELLRWQPPLARAKAERTDFVAEDAVLDRFLVRLGPAFFAPFLEDISGWLECIARRDQGGLNYAWLRDMFTGIYGAGGRCDNILQFATAYRRELNILISGQADRSSDIGYPRGNLVNAQILRYLETLAAESDAGAGTYERAIEPGIIEALTETFDPPPDEPLSAAMHLQIAAASWEAVEQGDFLVVLNYTLPGFGHFFTRYCYLFEDQDGHSPLTDQIRAFFDQLQEQLPENQRLVELLSVLDHNAQVHPCFTAEQLVPPDEISALPEDQQVRVKTLRLEHDALSDQLRLFAGDPLRAGAPGGQIVPMYMGFFHLMALPALHRLFVEMSPTGYHMERVRPGEHQENLLIALAGTPEPAQVRHYPRLRIGRFVLQREMWAFPTAALPERDAPDEFTRFLQTYTWARRHGLPREVFVRIKRDPRRGKTDFHTGHKPIHVDFENYFSVKTLWHLIDEANVLAIHVEEMLPGPDELFFEVEGQRYAVEFQVEFNRGGPTHG